MKARIWTVPNQITFLRLGFLPFFLILILYEEYRWALLVLVCAALTDAVDGLLARRLDQKSALGAYLNPIADKLLLSSSFVVLAMEKKIPWWLTILVLSRDMLMLVVAAVILLIQGYQAVSAESAWQVHNVFEIALVFFTVLAAGYVNDRVSLLAHYLGYTVAALVIASGFHYSIVVARRLPTCRKKVNGCSARLAW